MLHTGKMKRACLRRISRWHGRSSSEFLEANGGASADGTALYPRRASAELPRRLAVLAASSCVLARAHAAAALDKGLVILNFLCSTTFMLTTFQNSKWILNWRFKLEKGTLSGNLNFQNYFKFYIETSKTQNTKVVHLDKIYNFAFGLNLKF